MRRLKAVNLRSRERIWDLAIVGMLPLVVSKDVFVMELW